MFRLHFSRPPACSTFKRFRVQTGISLEVIAAKTGLEIEWLEGFEAGTRLLWPDARRKIARFFGARQADLFPEFKEAEEITLHPKCLKLKEIRQSRGINQSKLGWKAKLSPCYISRFENGAAKPWPNAIINICRVLDVDPGVIFGHLPPETIRQCREELGKPFPGEKDGIG
jgi:transcriptional regulator with XRE-family HTH domain